LRPRQGFPNEMGGKELIQGIISGGVRKGGVKCKKKKVSFIRGGEGQFIDQIHQIKTVAKKGR